MSPTPPLGPDRWDSLFRAALRGRPEPLLITQDATIPGASLWTGARLWRDAFRQAGLCPGDRVALALPPSPAFIMALVAGFCEGLTVVPVAPEANLEAVAERIDARAVVGGREGPGAFGADTGGVPVPPVSLRETMCPASPSARLLMHSSGSVHEAKVIALSDANILAVLESHRPLLGLAGRRVLSVLPWHHAFGLIIDLLPALLDAERIVRDPSGGRDPVVTLAAIERWGIDAMSMVPLQGHRLFETPGGAEAVRRLRAGVIGGAPVCESLATVLQDTGLRVGYGLTEASPGVMLGEPGVWFARTLGRPVGCEVRIDPDGTLRVRGPNVALGAWAPEGLWEAPKHEWLDTADLVEHGPDGYVFLGRRDHGFKLPNGLPAPVGAMERALERIPGVHSAVVLPEQGRGFRLLLVTPATRVGNDDAPILEAIGEHRRWLRRIDWIAPDQVATSPKGEPVRPAAALAA